MITITNRLLVLFFSIGIATFTFFAFQPVVFAALGNYPGSTLETDNSSFNSSFTSTGINAARETGSSGGVATFFSSGNVGVTFTYGNANTSFAAVTGGTQFFSNGDGTYNTITVSYSSPAGESCSGGSLVSSCGESSPPSPSVSLYVKNITKNSKETRDNISIGLTDEIQLRWRTNNVNECITSANPTDPEFVNRTVAARRTSPDGTDTTVTEPVAGTARTYTVTCAGPYGTRSDSLVVTRPMPPTTTLYVKNTTQNLPETTNDITIGLSDQIQLRWSATGNPTSCTASASPADSAFSTRGRTSGTDTTVTEPLPAASRVFSVTCSNAAGNHTDSIRVTKDPDASSCEINGSYMPTGSSQTFYQSSFEPFGGTCVSETRTCTNGLLSGSYTHASCTVGSVPVIDDADMSIDAHPKLIRFGEDSDIVWTARNVDTCTVSGPGLNVVGLNGSETIRDVTAESKFTLRCTSGPTVREESVTVKVLPRIQET